MYQIIEFYITHIFFNMFVIFMWDKFYLFQELKIILQDYLLVELARKQAISQPPLLVRVVLMFLRMMARQLLLLLVFKVVLQFLKKMLFISLVLLLTAINNLRKLSKDLVLFHFVQLNTLKMILFLRLEKMDALPFFHQETKKTTWLLY